MTERGVIVAKLAPGVGGGLTEKSILPEAPSPIAGVFQIAHLRADRVGAQDGVVFAQAGVEAASFDFNARPVAAELSDDLHISGGMLAQYDGAQVCEHGFHLYPENVTASASGSGSFTGQYQFAVVYEWMDGYGLLHRSAPSVPVTVTAASAAQFDLTIPTLRLTDKSTPVSLVVYRTEANQTVFYRASSVSSPLLNDKTVDSISFTDTTTDAALLGREQLYTTGGELENIAAPAPSFVTRYRNRAVVLSAERPLEWHFSKQVISGAPVEFSDALYGTVEAEGGGLTAAIEMDDKLVLFKRERIYYVVGNGPTANGENSDYSDPLRIPADVGCVTPRSVVLTPAGVMFQSAKGIYLLGRDLSVSYAGADVEPWNDKTVTSARVSPDTREIRFTLESGERLVLDYYTKQWISDTRISAADAVVFGGLCTHIAPTGAIMQETPGEFADDGEPILRAFRSSWLSFAGLSGYQRAWKLILRGDYRSPHKIVVHVATDDNPAPVQNLTIDPATILEPGSVGGSSDAGVEDPGGGPYPAYVWRVPMLRQKCASLQVTVEEVQAGTEYGEGSVWAAMTFQVGVVPGTTRVPAARTKG